MTDTSEYLVTMEAVSGAPMVARVRAGSYSEAAERVAITWGRTPNQVAALPDMHRFGHSSMAEYMYDVVVVEPTQEVEYKVELRS